MDNLTVCDCVKEECDGALVVLVDTPPVPTAPRVSNCLMLPVDGVAHQCVILVCLDRLDTVFTYSVEKQWKIVTRDSKLKFGNKWSGIAHMDYTDVQRSLMAHYK